MTVKISSNDAFVAKKTQTDLIDGGLESRFTEPKCLNVLLYPGYVP